MKYSYTDPIEAAWMHFKHGMKFTSKVVQGSEVVPYDLMLFIDDPKTLHTALNLEERDFRLFVHPDSLHLLEPRRNDIISQQTEIGPGVKISFGGKLEDRERVVSRNGKPFFWPESE